MFPISIGEHWENPCQRPFARTWLAALAAGTTLDSVERLVAVTPDVQARFDQHRGVMLPLLDRYGDELLAIRRDAAGRG